MSKLPGGWCPARLGELCSRIVDGSHNPPKAAQSGKAMLSARNIQGRRILFDDFRWISESAFAVEHGRTQIAPGDVLLTIVGTIGRTAVVPTDSPSFALQRSVAVLKAQSTADPRYLAYVLESPAVQRYLVENAKGTAQKGIYLGALGAVEVPLAPTLEQKRIADRLDALLARVDICRARLDRGPTILKRLRQSILATATSGDLTKDWREERGLSSEWKDAALGSLLVDVRYGTSKKCAYEPRKTPVLRIPNIVGGAISHEDIKYAEFDKDEHKRLALVPGDILMIRSNGSLGLVGQTALVSERESGFLYAGYLIRLRPDAAQARSAYLSLFLGSPSSRTRIEQTARSTTGVNNINAEEIRGFPVPVPALDEQDEIIRRVGVLFEFANQLERRLTSAQSHVERTTPSILAKAFRGELVPQDPSDEPASALLERIRRAASGASSGSISGKRHKARPRKELDVAMKNLIDVLTDAGDWMDAQEAFRACGVADGADTDLIEGIYSELRELERGKRVIVKAVKDAKGRKLHDRLKIAATA